MENRAGLGREVIASRKDDELVRGQALVLKTQLKLIGLDGFPVQEGTEVRHAKFFAKRMTMGYVGYSDISVALLVGSESNKCRVSSLLIAPTMEGSGLLVDPVTETVWTDSFWIVEGGTFKHVQPTEPIPLDGIDTSFAGEMHPVIKKKNQAQYTFDEIAEDKQVTKQILAKRGISVPRGIFVPHGAYDVDERLTGFLEENPDVKGLVIKPNSESQGNGVLLLDLADSEFVEKAYPHMLGLIKSGHEFLVEERIGNVDEEIDVNYRILTTISPIRSRAIDGEVRFAERGDNPVNVSKGAHAIRLDNRDDPGAVIFSYLLYNTAERATEAIAEEVATFDEDITGFAGIDIKPWKGRMYVFEVNGSRSGGFGTLTKLDKKPLTSIRNILIPASLPYLSLQFENRQEVDPKNLLSTSRSDEESIFFDFAVIALFQDYYNNKNYPKAIDVLQRIGPLASDQNRILMRFAWVANETDEYDPGLMYINSLLESDPTNEYYLDYKQRFEDAQEEVRQASQQ